jgi:predicted nucleotidyltransferase
MGRLLDERRGANDSRLERLRADLEDAERAAGKSACVYVTGSFARGEASDHSDLDLFIAGASDKTGKRKLSRLKEVLIKAELIRATDSHGIPEFSGDGRVSAALYDPRASHIARHGR